MAVRYERKRRFNKIMEKNTSAAEKLTHEEISQASGGEIDLTDLLEAVPASCKEHRWSENKCAYTSNGQYRELECSVCGKVKYEHNGNPISKQEFYEAWSYSTR